MGYLANFIVYTLAMVGVIVLALLVFKTSSGISSNKKSSKYLKVIDAMSLAPRKTLYIVSAGEEKFLIAGDADKTTLISKLNQQDKIEETQKAPDSFKTTLEQLPKKGSYIDKSIIGISSTQNKPYDSAIKNLAVRLRGE